ncbi:uncharacterized protein K02A2.6-like [Culex pipiens pallens]|uniref:uncharacterized protein K02A2.6-like n=1 Tax=Culex pipiens pallens TaxID=42434 RepID=UPI0019542BF0|nr:uncharacterized protein K02A2.6-like [Culex pipiens pallens]
MSNPPGINKSGSAGSSQASGEQPFKDTIIQLLANQHALMEELTEQVKNLQAAPRNELVLDSLATNITEFVYDADKGCTFDTWYGRYADLFDADASSLDDAAKVRLLLRKLSPAAHDRYTSFILPKVPKDFKFKETVDKLKSIFGTPVSIFHRRYQCLQTAKDESEDLISYSCRVNRACVDFQLKKLDEEQLKCLVFVCGLTAAKDSDIRMRLLSKINESQGMTLEKIVEECKSLATLKQDTVLIGSHASSSVQLSTNAVRTETKQKPKGKFGGKQRDNIPKSPCWSCGGMHYMDECKFREHKCRDCNRVGHREGYCSCFSAKNRTKKEHKFQPKPQQKQRSSKSVTVGSIQQGRRYTTVGINGVPVELQLDSGSDITILSYQNWEKAGRPPTVPPDCSARAASGDKLNISGMFSATISIGGVHKQGKCYVSGPQLNLNVLGADAMDKFGLWDVPLSSICNLVASADEDADVAELKSRFADVFSDRAGVCKKTQVHLDLKPDAKPVFRQKRPVAYSMEAIVEDELQRLQDLGIITPVTYADWAAPIVVVRKPDRSIRICADYSTGLNNALEPNSHPLPLPEDIFARMANCTIFANIDLSDAYLQVEVDEESRKLLVINTHKGLFQYNRLSLGIKNAPGAFQKIMDTMLCGLPRTCPYLDDIIVGGRTRQELKQNLQQVFQRLQEYGFTVKLSKCRFFMNQVKYLGQLLDAEGIRPDPEKIAAVVNMPALHDVSSLRSYLGAINYYGKFIKEMRRFRQPLDDLLRKGAKFVWSADCQRSFDRFKEILQSPLLLTHYNPRLDIVVSADASNVGIGARIAHRFPDGTEKAIYHASRSLTPAEKNYSQIEKEALALVYAVTKFHRMIYGRNFLLQTDHKPLLSIFGSKQGIPAYTANRLQRWALTMLLYDFHIEHIATDHFGHADILSRLINAHVKPDEDFVIASIELERSICSIVSQSLGFLPVTYKVIAAETEGDETLQKVKHYVIHGWPENKKAVEGAEIQQFFARREALSIAHKCLMYGERIIIPKKLQKRVLQQLHKGHPGIERSRSLARNYVYWPNIDDHISNLIKACNECAAVAKTDTKTALSSWPIPERPWQRLHVDYAGPVDGTYFLVLVDALSKWPEVVPTRRITTEKTLAILRNIFSRFGMPEVLVSDNGRQFCSEHFERYCDVNGIMHLKTAPYHPQSNGQAERFVDTFKRTLKKIQAGGEELEEAIDTFLQCYRSTPCRSAPEGKSPAEVLLGGRIRTSLELMKPPSSFYKDSSSKQDQQFDRKHGAKAKIFEPKYGVFAKVHHGNEWSWVPGEVVERIGTVMYNVWLPDRQQLIRSHSNQLRKRHGGADATEAESQPTIPLDLLINTWGIKPPGPSESPEPAGSPEASLPYPDSPLTYPEDEQLNELQQEFLRELMQPPERRRPRRPQSPAVPAVAPAGRPVRNRKAPSRYEPYHLY